MLQLIRSRANTGKSSRVLQMIRANGDKRHQILLVPDHASYAAEVDLCRACGDEGNQYAEVLTFQRLSRRVVAETGGFERMALDGGGKVLLMQRALQDVFQMLTVYRRPSQRAAFLRGFIDLVEELRRYCVTPEMLMEQSAEAGGEVGDKFRDIALIYGAYMGRLSRDGVDLTDDMEKLNRKLRESDYLTGKDVYIDGFSHFTAQEEHAIALILPKVHRLTVTLLGEADSHLEIFLTGNRAFDRLVRIAGECGAAVEEVRLDAPPVTTALGHMERYTFGGGRPCGGGGEALRLYEAATLYSEVEYAAAEIRRLAAEEGLRYRDIGVAVRNLQDYEAAVENIFRRYEVPVYLSRRSDLLEKPLMTLVTAALEAVTGGFEYEDVFRCLKTGLAGLSDGECDLLENYVLKWEIHGAMWLRDTPWTANPDGYCEEFSEEQRQRLEEVNAIRERVRLPFARLSEALRSAQTAQGKVLALYGFLEELDVPGQLTARTEALLSEGRLQLSDEYAQLWELVCQVMDQFVEILADGPVSSEEFLRLWKLMVGQYSVGTIPAAMDQVSFQQLDRNDRHQVKVLFLLGANDHVLPAAGRTGGILTEEEREVLLSQGLRLAPHGMDQMNLELQNIYGALVKPSQRLYVSYCAFDSAGTALRPAFVVGRLRALFPDVPLKREGHEKPYRAAAPLPAVELAGEEPGGALWRYFAARPAWRGALERMTRGASMGRGRLSPSAVDTLYGRNIRMSASRIDKVRSCHFAYFMQYGLRLKERSPAGLDPAQIGTFLHYVLEHVAQDAMAEGGFAQLAPERLREITKEHIDGYISSTIGPVEEKEARFRYLLRRLRTTVYTVVENVSEELRASDFVPLRFELGFGGDGPLPAITIEEAERRLSVSGKVDRVDGWVKGDKLYLRVVDYKTGRKSFDLTDIRHGLNIQMLLYLFALEREGGRLFGKDIVPAGVLYLPARDVILNMDRGASAEAVQRAVDRELRRSGLVLKDAEVLSAMEHTALTEPRFLPLALDRKHNITKGIATAEELGKLSRYVDHLLHQVAREVTGGNIDADPCTYSEAENACTYCEFASACHFGDGAEDQAHYIYPLPREEFFREIEGEIGDTP